LAFDLYGTLVDPLAIATELDRVLPGGQGKAIARLWRQKQLEYSFRATVMDRYRDFRWLTERALGYALTEHDVTMPASRRAELIGLYDRLAAFDDAAPALRELTRAGHRLVVFSNGSPDMIRNCVANCGLAEYLESWISVDPVRAFKPAPLAYRHLARTLGLEPTAIRLVSCNAFDIDGARAVGLATVWVNRSGGPFDGLADAPAHTITRLTELPDVIAGPRF
jgi:2-haloacid dehalogenase